MTGVVYDITKAIFTHLFNEISDRNNVYKFNGLLVCFFWTYHGHCLLFNTDQLILLILWWRIVKCGYWVRKRIERMHAM